MICSKYKTTSTIKIDTEYFDWNYRSLSVFLNEITGFRLDEKNGYHMQINVNKEIYYFFWFVWKKNQQEYILANIEKDIKVRASKILLDSWCSETYKPNFTRWQVDQKLFCEIRHYYTTSDFSLLFQSFASSFIHMKVEPNNFDKMQIYDFFESFKSTNF